MTPHVPSADPVPSVFRTSRTFRAAPERLWRAWTDREQLTQWFGPAGFTMPDATLDLRPGGAFHYLLRSPDGHGMWGKWVFREVAGPGRLVLVDSFSDEHGGLTRHPFEPNWPLQMLTTLDLQPDGDQTVLNLQWVPMGASDAERRTFDSNHGSMRDGWAGTFAQLAAFLDRAE